VRVKVAEEVYGETATDEGTARAGALLVTATESPAAGAGLERVTAQEVVEPAARLVASHCREEIIVAEIRATEVLTNEPLRVAVIVAF